MYSMADKKEQRNWLETFYKGLQNLVDSTFPKKCNKCGKVYESKQEFLAETMPVRDISLEDKSGLFSLEGGGMDTAVGVFRNCKCGTTLMVDFQDRRDNSVDGQNRRDEFKKLLDALVEHGVKYDIARDELLKVLEGKRSEIIEDLLGEIKLH